MNRCPTCGHKFPNDDRYVVTSDGEWLGFEYDDPEHDQKRQPEIFSEHFKEYCPTLAEARQWAKFYANELGDAPAIWTVSKREGNNTSYREIWRHTR